MNTPKNKEMKREKRKLEDIISDEQERKNIN